MRAVIVLGLALALVHASPPRDFHLVASVDGRLHAYTDDGSVLWSAEAGGSTVGSYQASSTIESGQIVPGGDGSVFLHTPQGTMSRFPLSVESLADATPFVRELDSGVSLNVVGSRSSKVFVFDASNGRLISTRDSFGSALGALGSRARGVAVGRIDYRVRAFDVSSGEEMWNFTYAKFVDSTDASNLAYDDGNAAMRGEIVASFDVAWDGDGFVLSTQNHERLLTSGDDDGGVSLRTLSLPDGSTQTFASLSYKNNMQHPEIISAVCSQNVRDQIKAVFFPQEHTDAETSLVPFASVVVAQKMLPAPVPEVYSTTMYVAAAGIFVFAQTLLVFGLRRRRRTTEDINGSVRTVGRLIFDMDNVKGFGCHGTIVVAGTLDGRPVAVKRMQSSFFARADKEIDLLIKSDGHSNVVRYFAKEATRDFVFLALELCSFTLDDALCAYDGDAYMRDDDTIQFLYAIADATSHLHDLQIAHCDIKPANVLVVERPNPSCTFGSRWTPKISDMGLSKVVSSEVSMFAPSSSAVASKPVGGGTTGWRAPELLTSRGGSVSRKVDVWSLGCIFYYVLERGNHPFGDPIEREHRSLRRDFVSAPINVIDGSAWHALITEAMLVANPQRRCSAKFALNHVAMFSATKALGFLTTLSDRIEAEENSPSSSTSALVSRLERECGVEDWICELTDLAKEDASGTSGFRKYRRYSVRDLLRFIRNKRSHFNELANDLKIEFGGSSEGLFRYIDERFPQLLRRTHAFCENCLSFEAELFDDFFFAQAPEDIALRRATAAAWYEASSKPIRGWYCTEHEFACVSNSSKKKPVVPSRNHKSMLCDHWEKSAGNRCVVGNKCGFAHGLLELRDTKVPKKNATLDFTAAVRREECEQRDVYVPPHLRRAAR